jgi:hypothetical protein
MFSEASRNYLRRNSAQLQVDPIDALFAALDNLLESFKIYAAIYKIFTPARLRLSGTRHYLSGNKDAASTKWARALLIAQQKGTKVEEAKIQLESYLRLQHETTTVSSSSSSSSSTSSSSSNQANNIKKARARTQSNLSSSLSSYLDTQPTRASASSRVNATSEIMSLSSLSTNASNATLNVWKDDPRVTASIEALCDCGASELANAALKLTGSQGRINAVMLSEGPIETL